MYIKEIFPSATLPEAREGRKVMLSKKKKIGDEAKRKIRFPSLPLQCNITTNQSRPYSKPLSLTHAVFTRRLFCTLFLGGSALSHCHKYNCLLPPEEL